MTDQTPTRIKRSRLASLLIGSALIVAACGGAADTTEEPSVAALPETTESADGTEDKGGTNSNTGDENDETNGTTSDMTPEEAQLAFSQCLEEQGIEDPFSNGDGETIDGAEGGQSAGIAFESDADFEEFEAAMDECSDLLGDAFGEFEPTPEQEAQLADAELKFNQCMSDKGFTVRADGALEFEGDDFEALEAAASECDDAFDAFNESLDEDGEGN